MIKLKSYKKALNLTLHSLLVLDLQRENSVAIGFHINSMLNRYSDLTFGEIISVSYTDDYSYNQTRLKQLINYVDNLNEYNFDILCWTNFENSLGMINNLKYKCMLEYKTLPSYYKVVDN